jgi:hypothetical protein
MTTTLDRPVAPAQLAHLDIAVCRRCSDDLEHCHDTLVNHVVGEVHCTAADCTTPAELHELVISCIEVSCDCNPSSAVVMNDLG